MYTIFAMLPMRTKATANGAPNRFRIIAVNVIAADGVVTMFSYRLNVV